LGKLGDDRPGVGLGADKLPDIEWASVSGEPFVMGEGDASFPCNLFVGNPYRISKYPITVRQYRAFIDAGGYENDDYWAAIPDGLKWRNSNNIKAPEDYGEPFNFDNHPQVGVCWYEAVAFCNWFSEQSGTRISLATEAQWERAARHTDGRIYPWGPKYEAGYCNVDDAGIGSTSAVGIFPIDTAECGAMDMAGNVWEWCCSKWRDDYADYERSVDDDLKGDDSRVLRGGCWFVNRDFARCANRDWSDPNDRGFDVGFRCVRT
jgi:formylglycine-generating enzyme required for sulfatase activity